MPHHKIQIELFAVLINYRYILHLSFYSLLVVWLSSSSWTVVFELRVEPHLAERGQQARGLL